MPRTPYATEIHDTPQKSVRIPSAGQPSFIVIHHAATESFRAVVTMELGTKQVSSTVVIKDGQVASMFDEVYRAWSLSSQLWDSKSLSSETCNSGGAAQGWPISEESYATLAKVVADWCIRWGIPCNRERIMGHREVYTRYGASYATACPGGINLDRVVNDANARISSGTAGGGTTPINNGGFLMALSDAEQLEILNTVRALAGYVWKGGDSVSSGIPGQDFDPKSVIGRVNTIQDATFYGGTSMPDEGKSIGQSLADIQDKLDK